MPTIREWLTENKPKFKNRVVWINECAEKLKVSQRAVQNVATDLWPAKENPEKSKSFNEKMCDVISASNFLGELDDVGKVLAFLNSSVKDDYIEEEKLRRNFGISQTRWKDLSGLPVFENRRLAYQKPGGTRVVVFSSVKGIEAAKKTISMARYEQ